MQTPTFANNLEEKKNYTVRLSTSERNLLQQLSADFSAKHQRSTPASAILRRAFAYGIPLVQRELHEIAVQGNPQTDQERLLSMLPEIIERGIQSLQSQAA